jgi:hypothetical protein
MKLSAEVMALVASRVCTYRCGECEYYETAAWSQHEAHYEAHVAARVSN